MSTEDGQIVTPLEKLQQQLDLINMSSTLYPLQQYLAAKQAKEKEIAECKRAAGVASAAAPAAAPAAAGGAGAAAGGVPGLHSTDV